jgi:hypothetical protein
MGEETAHHILFECEALGRIRYSVLRPPGFELQTVHLFVCEALGRIRYSLDVPLIHVDCCFLDFCVVTFRRNILVQSLGWKVEG